MYFLQRAGRTVLYTVCCVLFYSVCFAQTAALQLRGCCCAAVAAALQLVAAGCCVAAVCCGAASLHDADVWYYLLLFDAALLLNM